MASVVPAVGSDAPLLTVLLPVFNTPPAFLREAIDSIRAQSQEAFELLIVDNGSTSDDTKSVLKHYAEKDGRIRLLVHEKNLGLVAALNDGLAAARGALIARMDADDIALPHRLEQQMEFLNQHADIDVVGSAVQIIRSNETQTEGEGGADRQSSPVSSSSSPPTADPSPSPAAAIAPLRIITHPSSPSLVEWSLPFYCCLAHPTVMFRRDVIVRAGGYRPGWTCAEDYELWLRLQRRGVRMANLPSVLLHLRKHSSNVSSAHRTAAIQQHHAALAVQAHLSQLLDAPVGVEYARGLVRPTTLTSVGDLMTLAHLLRALEARVTREAHPDDRAAIRADCTARLGELATLAMQVESPSSTPALAADPVPVHALADSFSLPASKATASDLMAMWMKRGADASAMLALLMRKK